jgi:hypothetical protein
MADRRSLAQAIELTPSTLAFIQGGAAAEPSENQSAIVSKPLVTKQRGTKPRKTPLAGSAGPSNGQSSQPHSEIAPETPAVETILASLTTRIRPSTAEALRRFCLENKLRRQKPDSVQEIVQNSLDGWLKAHAS